MVLDEGGTNIPFSAIKEINKYELYVTNLSLDTDVNIIKRHVSNMLGTSDVTVKSIRKEGDSCLSCGIFFSSKYDNLDVEMPGLWPRGTTIYKWDHNRMGHYGNRRNNGPGRNNQGRSSAQGQRHQSTVNQGQNGSRTQTTKIKYEGLRIQVPRPTTFT